MRFLQSIKLIHTVVWAFFAGCIVMIPLASLRGEHAIAGWLVAIVGVEVVILAANGWRCPLTPVAARYTSDRRPNFDIYLPAGIAKNNKLIFGALYVAGTLFALFNWLLR